MALRVLVLSLIPNADHVIFSLRIAAALQHHLGARIDVLRPDEASLLSSRMPGTSVRIFQLDDAGGLLRVTRAMG